MNLASKVAAGILSIILVCALGLYAQQKIQATVTMPPAPMPIEPITTPTLPTTPVTPAPVLSEQATQDLIASLGTSTTTTQTVHPTTPIAVPAMPLTKAAKKEAHKEAPMVKGPEHKLEPEHALMEKHEATAHEEILSKLAAIDSRLIVIESTLQNLAQELVTITQPAAAPAMHPAEAHMPAEHMHAPAQAESIEEGNDMNEHGSMEHGMHAITDVGEPMDDTENNWDF